MKIFENLFLVLQIHLTKIVLANSLQNKNFIQIVKK